MKKKLLGLHNVMIRNSSGIGFQKFSLEIHQGDMYGIICGSIEERNVIFSFFSNQCDVSGGRITYNNVTISVRELAGIFRSDLTVIGEESKLIGSISVAENICLKKNLGWVRQRVCEAKAQTYLERLGLKFRTDRMPAKLSVKERVQVELIRAFVEDKRLIILMDLSGFLSDLELNEVYQVMRRMRKATFVLLEPFGQLVFDWSDRLMVTRDWQVNGCFHTDLVDKEKLFSYLSMSKGPAYRDDRVESGNRQEVIAFRHVTAAGLQDLTFRVGKGEILNICCLDERSIRGVRDLLFGNTELLSGSIVYRNREMHFSGVHHLRKNGIAYIAAAPGETMLQPNMRVLDDVMLDLSKKMPMLWLKPRYRKSIEQKLNEEIQEGISECQVSELTGVMKQKLVYTKIMLAAPKVVFCERPFFNVDLHMREVALESLKGFQRRNMAVVVLLRNTRDIELLEGKVLYLRNERPVEDSEWVFD